MTNSQPHARKPTSAQLGFLRDLALRAGESFAYPQTFAQADREIKRLLGRKASGRDERRRETRAVRREVTVGRGDAAAVRASETEGYGSSARWRHGF